MRAANGIITHFVRTNCEFNVTNQVATTYCPCNGRPVAMKQGLTVTYMHHDQLGSLVSATNSAGQEVGSARYYPFGGRHAAASPSSSPALASEPAAT